MLPAVLWIEDDPQVLAWAREMLARSGLGFEFVTSGAAAIVRASTGHHDLIVLDWKLPDVSGEYVLREVRRAGVTTRVIVCTGYYEHGEEAVARSAGADAFVAKPLRLGPWRLELAASLFADRAWLSGSRRDWLARLFDGDTGVAEEIAAVMLPVLRLSLPPQARDADDAMIGTAAADALLEFFRKPLAFDPLRSSLESFLKLAAVRNLRNLERSARRRRRHELPGGDDLDDVPAEVKHTITRWRDLRAVFRSCRTSEERAFLLAKLRGERRTPVLAALLGAADLPAAAERVLVHRVQERLRLRMRRRLLH